MNNYDSRIAEIISVEHYNLNCTYGTLRLKHHIQQKYGLVLNHKLIRRYKKHLNLQTKVRKLKPIYIKLAKEKNLIKNKAPNLINNNFTSNKPFEKLSSDVSYINCNDGRLYLSAVKDLFNNEIISYSISTKNDINLIKSTLKSLPKASSSNSIIHTDQGSLYYSGHYIETVEKLGYKRSMSNKGRCWENSPIENWFSQIKEECLRNRKEKLTKAETVQEIKKYVQWYNTERIQKDLEYHSPSKYKSFFI